MSGHISEKFGKYEDMTGNYEDDTGEYEDMTGNCSDNLRAQGNKKDT